MLSLYQDLHKFDSQQSNRLDRWRNLEPEWAELLSIIVRTKLAKNVLEIGTSNGYSTIWLADALETTDGHITSLEIDEERTKLAKAYLKEFNLDHRAQCLTIDAAEFLEKASPIYDFVFLDAERSYYTSYWPALQRLLLGKSDCLLVVDNIISHQSELAAFIDLIDSNSGMIKTTVNVGAGLLLVTRA